MKYGVQYDYYLDIDRAGLQKFANIVTQSRADGPSVPGELLYEGWESCLHGGSPSIIAGRPKIGHGSLQGYETVAEKNERIQKHFCTADSVALVKKIYAADYDLLSSLQVHNASQVCGR